MQSQEESTIQCLPKIKINLAENIAITLIDSGAAISLINREIFEQTKEFIAPNYVSRQVKIVLFTKQTVNFDKTVDINFKIENKKFRHIFFVTPQMANSDFKVVLGSDFLQKFHIVLDIAKQIMTHNKQTFVLTTHQTHGNTKRQQENSNTQVKQCFAIAERKIIVKPGEAKIIKLKCSKLYQNDTQVIFQKDPKFTIHEEFSTHLIENNTFLTVVYNESLRTKHFNKGEKLGIIIEDIEHPNDIEAELINTITASEEILKLRQKDLKETEFELKHLPVEMQTEISTFLRDNYEVFSTRYKTLGMTDTIIPDIKLSHNYPIQLKSYPLPKKLIEVADKEIAELLEAGIFENVTSSSYTFPMILIKKKGTDRYRLAIDFRLLNNITELFKISVPRIKDIIQDISGFKYYATIDLKAAFLQICLPPSMQEL